MDFVIHRNLIGSKMHRASNGEWIEDIPNDCWVAGDPEPEKDLLMALWLSGFKIKVEPPRFHLKVFRNFTLKEDLPWEMALPKDLFESWVQGLSDKISNALETSDLAYYENIFKRSCNVLETLRPMKIHKKKWNFLSTHDIQGVNSEVVDSFEPNEKGFAEPIKYSLTDTISGRLKVTSGPEILRLNKELKSIIKSRYKGGKVVQFDYVSLEPRLALILAGRSISDDIYSDINKLLFDDQFSREIIKVSTLSVMYGAGAQSLSEKVDLPISVCKSTIQKLKEFFGIFKITKELIKQLVSDPPNKLIKNHFGRAIYPESESGHKLYNHFIQSTAVDAVMLGFSNIVELIKETRAIPIFIIHDNIGLDLPPEMLTTEWFEKIKSCGAEIPGLPGKLLLESDSM